MHPGDHAADVQDPGYQLPHLRILSLRPLPEGLQDIRCSGDHPSSTNDWMLSFHLSIPGKNAFISTDQFCIEDFG